MHDPKPVFWLLIASALGLLALVGWWLGLPAPERLARLTAVQQVEQVATPPPTTLEGQAAWLVQHRLVRVQGLALVAALAAGIGLVEGTVRRQHDPLGGMRFACWTLGVLLSALTVGAGATILVLPWPLPPLALTMGLAMLAGSALSALAFGRPLLR